MKLQDLIKIGIVLLVLAVNFESYSQSEKKRQKFENKLNEFRYSLYADLEDTEELNEIFEKNNQSHPLVKKLENFIKENEKEILAYQTYNLSKYKDNFIDFQSFTKDTVFFGESGKVLKEFLETYDHMMSIYGESFGKFLSLNPLNGANTVKNVYLSQTLSVSEMGRLSMKDALASPKIKSIEMDNSNWKIWTDHYSRLYEFEFNLASNKIKLVGVYVRK